jgi:hypothetical protein
MPWPRRAFNPSQVLHRWRDKAQLRLNPKGFEVEGKSEFNERGTSDEDDNEIQIHASQSNILAVNRLLGRCCNAARRLCRESLRNPLLSHWNYTPSYHDYYGNPYSYSGYGPREFNHGDRY